LARPRKPRRVACLPGVTYFKPQGIPLRFLEEVQLSVDELEALRLKDLEGMEQEEAAGEMNISRQTFQRILEDAHRKVAESLVRGKALRIEGGDYEVAPLPFRCRRCGHGWEEALSHGSQPACPSCEEEVGMPGPGQGLRRGRASARPASAEHPRSLKRAAMHAPRGTDPSQYQELDEEEPVG
jgi:uncharacterized protein